MSLSTVKLTDIVNRQYVFKLRTNTNLFSSLILLQIFGIIFSMGGSGSSGSSYYNITYYTADFIIGFTMIWAFIIAIQLMSNDYSNHDFTFVTNRLATNLSNSLFLITASVIGSITAILSGYFLSVLNYLFFKIDYIYRAPTLSVSELLINIVATTLYVILFSFLGYLVGALVKRSRIFIFVLPGLALGFLIIFAQVQSDVLLKVFDFYFSETVFILFVLKVVLTSILLFVSSILLTNRMEVN